MTKRRACLLASWAFFYELSVKLPEQSLGEALRQARQNGCSEVLLRQFQARRLKGKEYDFALTYDEIWYDARTGLVRTAVSRTTDTGKMTPIEALLALAGAD